MISQKLNFSSFFKTILTISIPIALQNLLATTASMVDTIMIGSEGQLAVAAVGICSQISSLFFACYFGFASGALLFFSQYWGARHFKGINSTFGISFLFMLAVSLAFAAVAIFAPAFLLGIYTDKENIIAIGIPYIRIIGFVYPLQVIGVLLSFLMRATERVKAPLFCSILALVVNFCLNYVLIYGRFGFPKMGPTGAAIGTLASSIVNIIALCIFAVISKCEFRFHLREMFQFRGGFAGAYLTKCLPIIANELLYGVGQMLINIVIGHQTESAIAAMAAFRVLEGFVFAFFGGLADASSVVVGKHVGSGQHMQGYRNTIGFAILCPFVTFAICSVLLVFHHPIFTLFGLESEAISYGKYMLLIYLVAGSVRTCNYIMNNCYRAGGESLFGAVMDACTLFLLSVPATWISGMILQLPFLLVFIFVYADEPVKFVLSILHTRSGKWVKPVTPQGQAALPEFHAQLQQLRHPHKKGVEINE